MSACTCYAMIGRTSREGEGLRVNQMARLLEGSRPAWKMELPTSPEENAPGREVMWIPSLDRMLEDLIIMIGIHVIRTPELLDVAFSIGMELRGPLVEVYSIPKESRAALYEAARSVDGDFKLGLILFEGCHLNRPGGLEPLKEFVFDAEICRSSYRRVRTVWDDCINVRGSLE